MDSLNRVYFTYKLNMQKDLDFSAVQRGSYHPVLNLEGHLDIHINHSLFFSEPYIALLDLAICLHNWSNGVKMNKENNFHYQPIDHDEPILHLIKKAENNWYIYSQWQKFEVKGPLQLQRLFHSIEEFFKKIQIELYHLYGKKAVNYLYR